ncbi:hypothetical protein P3S67_000012 [Capsicum chacoense]
MWLGTLPELRVLSLSSNKLHGPIRTSGSEYMFLELRLLDLSSNAFTGNLPTSLFQHFRAIKKIDPSKKAPSDEIYGYYEKSIAVVTKGMEHEVLRILFLYATIDFPNNKFEGHIPSIIGDLIALSILNLSHNGLQGCGNDTLSETNYTTSVLTNQESNSEFLNDFWKGYLMGYGTGLCIGLSIIYIMISTGNMKWLERIVEELGHTIMMARRKKQGRQRNYRRRNNRF